MSFINRYGSVGDKPEPLGLESTKRPISSGLAPCRQLSKFKFSLTVPK